MISFNFTLSPDHSMNKEHLFQLQNCLVSVGMYLDLSLKDGMPQLTISIPDDFLEKISSSETVTETGTDEIHELPMDNERKHRGRPAVQPKNDLTLGQVRHMRFMSIPAETIAKEIGVSKRTFYRRLNEINGKNLSEDTPFSLWM